MLIPPGGSRPTLVVDTVLDVDAAMETLRSDLHGMGCPNGILFDESHCVILRDTFSSMEAASIIEDGRLSTDEVLERVAGGHGRSLDDRVERWLETLSSSWDQALSQDPEVAAAFITDIVPAAFGSVVRVVEVETGRARLGVGR
jgi:hypothetical protein